MSLSIDSKVLKFCVTQGLTLGVKGLILAMKKIDLRKDSLYITNTSLSTRLLVFNRAFNPTSVRVSSEQAAFDLPVTFAR